MSIVRLLNPSATALDMGMEIRFFDELGVLRFIEKSSDSEKNSTAVRYANEKPEPDDSGLTLAAGSGDLRVMSQNPESVLFVRRALQNS